MFDIDKYLNDINLVEMEISDDALTRTKKRCEEEQSKLREQRERGNKIRKGMLIAAPAAAVLLIGMLIGAALFSNATAAQSVAYYTVDVNPSICVHVDEQGLVTKVVSQNKDAVDIIKALDCAGKPATDVIREIIAAVKEAGYLGENNKIVLIGCFTADGTHVEAALGDLQSKLEADFGEMIELLIVSGSLDDLQAAKELQVSAGLLRLAQMADGVDVKVGEKVGEVAQQVRQVNGENFSAPKISAAVKDGTVKLSWDSLDFAAMGYAGNKVVYRIAAGDTEQETASLSAPEAGRHNFYTYGVQPLGHTVKLSFGATKYFAVYAQYGDIVKCSNVVRCTMPAEAAAPAPSASATLGPEKSSEPNPTQTAMPEHTVSGRVSGGKIILSWSEEASDSFQGYKVVASKTNPSPRYPEDGYIKYITDKSKTSVSLYEGTGGLKGDTYYYFSITYLFSDGSSVAGNAVRLKVPPKPADPTPKPDKTSGDYASSTISGSIDGTTVKLSWSKVEDSRFEGYKVVASFTNPNPKYPDDGYLYYITKASATSKNFSVSKLGSYEPGATCYFSITVVYNDAKKAGNSIALTIPAPPEDKPYAETSVNASLDGDTVRLTWNPVAVSDERFVYYKVVKSFSDTHPTYPDDGYIAYFSDPARSSYSIALSELGGKPGDKCYFSVTAVYEGDVRKTGGSASITIPAAPEP